MNLNDPPLSPSFDFASEARAPFPPGAQVEIPDRSPSHPLPLFRLTTSRPRSLAATSRSS